MPAFEPIAIIGQACVLPGALTPEQFWQHIVAGDNLLSPAPEGYWRVEKAKVLLGGSGELADKERAYTDQGGYVSDFAQHFNAEGFALPASTIQQLDPLFQWLLHCSREALHSAKLTTAPDNTGIILGNLSYPSHGLSQYSESVWLQQQKDFAAFAPTSPAVENRFNSGYPAQLVANALHLTGDAFCLDAACASSLYAIKLACDRLHDKQAHIMLAGAVNRADDLFLHCGFSSLKALSKTGRSLPFHAQADGLLPAEGAAVVVLKRLADAERDGDNILGVIRAVGLSNDGRSGGFLAPAASGQVRAMQDAYQQSGLSPQQINMIECHATGTPTGDSEELRSMQSIFQDNNNVPIGSLKSNMGHLITASGIAGLLKVLASMQHGIRPPTLNTEQPTATLNNSAFRLLQEAEHWPDDVPRIAAINNFGFGGNNAHLIVEQWHTAIPKSTSVAPQKTPIAIVGMGIMAGAAKTTAEFAQALFSSGKHQKHTQDIQLPLKGLRFPPADLQKTLPQQLAVMHTTQEALSNITTPLPEANTGVFIGMQCDAEISRYGLRWRLAQWYQDWHGIEEQRDTWLANAREGAIFALEPAGVIGAMPNIPANRLNSQYHWQGASFSVSSEELSGIHALDIAVRALRQKELDAAIVGAVEMGVEATQQSAIQHLLPASRHISGDASVSLVLKRLDDAKQDGDNIFAVISNNASHYHDLGIDLTLQQQSLITARFGHTHSASGLLHFAAASLACATRRQINTPHHWLSAQQHATQLLVQAFAGQSHQMAVHSDSQHHWQLPQAISTRLFVFSGADQQTVLKALQNRQQTAEGAARLVIVANDMADFEQKAQLAVKALSKTVNKVQDVTLADGIYYRQTPLTGELAFVFTGAAAAYRKMGDELLQALPQLSTLLGQRFHKLEDAANWAYDGKDTPPLPLQQLKGCGFLCQLHATLTQQILHLKPTATLGISSGETNAIFAMGAWQDIDDMFQEITDSGLYGKDLTGDCLAASSAWQLTGAAPWQNWHILTPVTEVEKLVNALPRVQITIINSDTDCVIAGHADECQQVIQNIGKSRVMYLNHDMVVHCEELRPVANIWETIHHRKTFPVEGVRFYSNFFQTHYQADSNKITQALTGQALKPIDFRPTVNNAWKDGVRIFLEHGPRNGVSHAIKTILGEREHLAISLEQANHTPIEQVFHAIAQLLAAGVAVDYPAFIQTLEQAHVFTHTEQEKTLHFAAHFPPVQFPPIHTTSQTIMENSHTHSANAEQTNMPPAPQLPSVNYTVDNDNTPTATTTATPSEISTTSSAAPIEEKIAQPSSVKTPTPPPPATSPDPNSSVLQQTIAATPHTASSNHSLNEFMQNTANLHTQFIQQQNQLHQQFLQLQGEIWQAVNQGHTTIPSSNSVSSTPTPSTTVPTPTPSISTPTVTPKTIVTTAKQSNTTDTPKMPTANAKKVVETTQTKENIQPPITTKAAPKATTNSVNPTSSSSLSKQTTLTTSDKHSNTSNKTEVDTQDLRYSPPPEGLQFSRKQLEILCSGKISSVFGDLFTQQDQYAIQVRMPEPPLLLADRVTGLKGEPGSMQKGIVWTETDVNPDSWYVQDGHMPPGIMIESGQADLLLISWLGADFLNKGERAYRLLGCELTYHKGGLPQVGDTLCYDIHVDGHAKHGDVRLFFFHYNCRVNDQLRLSVREGQAGFFSKEELDDSGGVLWSPEDDQPKADAILDPAVQATKYKCFSEEQVTALSEGRAFECFGEGFELTLPHQRTPKISAGKMKLFKEVTALDPTGGPWGRGYLRAETDIKPDDWFFDGHFKNDPCMPGTLMADASLQTMAFYLLSQGHAIDKDSWRFEPVPDEPYTFICRGQVTPESKHLIYEVFVEEIIAAPHPTIFAALLCSSDDLKVFQCRRFGLRLIPDWPLNTRRHLLEKHDITPRIVGDAGDVRGDYQALLACAWGMPSEAFGTMYKPFDDVRRVPRLPGPPYHFMSRVLSVEGDAGFAVPGKQLVSEYDIPADAWYFKENSNPVMPFCVLCEVLLQPCGWFGSFMGFASRSEDDLCIRNLDGDESAQIMEITPEFGTIRIEVTLTKMSQMGKMALIFLHVDSFRVSDNSPVLSLNTSFGFFTDDALANQLGLPVNDEIKAIRDTPSDYFLDLTQSPPELCDGAPRLPSLMLRMIDHITGYWPTAGKAGLGRIRCEQIINPDSWYFKAHFFQDPVQPGSLGLEALLQVLQSFMLLKGFGKSMQHPRFQAIATHAALIWKYRGQVTPRNKKVTTEMEITDIIEDDKGILVIGEGNLWVDGLRIYSVENMGMRIVEGTAINPPLNPASDSTKKKL